MEILQTNLQFLIPSSPLKNSRSIRASIWILLTFLFFFIGYKFLSKVLKVFVIHPAVPKINQVRTIDALWRVLFAAWIIWIFYFKVLAGKDINNLHAILQLTTTPPCNATLLNERTEDEPLEMLQFVLVAFLIHQLYTSLSSYSEPALVSLGSLVTLVFATNSLNCPNLCIQILFFLALNVGSIELAKFFYALKSRSRGYNGPPVSAFLEWTAMSFFLLHIFVWIPINFYLFPSVVLSQPSVTEVAPSARLPTIFINLFLVCFAKQQFFYSPAWTLLKLIVATPSAAHRIRSLKSVPAVVLLPHSNSLLQELRTIHLQFLSEAPPTSAEIRMLRRKTILSGKETSVSKESKKLSSDQAAELLSIVHCVKVLKRKMRHRYEQNQVKDKALPQVLSDEMGSSLSECVEKEKSGGSSNSCNDEESTDASNADEVTDIFIPVPSLSTEVPKIDENIQINDMVTPQGSLEVTADVHHPADDNKTELSEDDVDGRVDISEV